MSSQWGIRIVCCSIEIHSYRSSWLTLFQISPTSFSPRFPFTKMARSSLTSDARNHRMCCSVCPALGLSPCFTSCSVIGTDGREAFPTSTRMCSQTAASGRKQFFPRSSPSNPSRLTRFSWWVDCFSPARFCTISKSLLLVFFSLKFRQNWLKNIFTEKNSTFRKCICIAIWGWRLCSPF